MPVGFSFTADATKITSWLLEVDAARTGGVGVGVSVDGGGGERGGERSEGGSGRSGEGGGGGGAEGAAARLAMAIKVSTVDVQQLAAEAGLGSRGEVPSLQACITEPMTQCMTQDLCS